MDTIITRATRTTSTPPNTHPDAPASSPESSSLDHIETSGHLPGPPDTYRAFRCQGNEDEDQTVRDFYRLIDQHGGTTYETKVENCRTRASFYRHNETGEVTVFGSACRCRWCVLCANARAHDLSVPITDWLKSVRYPRFLTLTAPHSTDHLSIQLTRLYSQFRRFRRDPYVARAMISGLWCLQVTYNSARDEFHPHLHCLLVGTYRPQDWLLRKWQHYCPGVKILDIRAVDAPHAAANYIARYIARPTKLTSIPCTAWVQLWQAVHQRRLFGSWGLTPDELSLKRPKLDLKQWDNCGSWHYIVNMRASDPNADKLLVAWLTRKPLPEYISTWRTEYQLLDHHHPPPKNKSLIIEPYLPLET